MRLVHVKAAAVARHERRRRAGVKVQLQPIGQQRRPAGRNVGHRAPGAAVAPPLILPGLNRQAKAVPQRKADPAHRHLDVDARMAPGRRRRAVGGQHVARQHAAGAALHGPGLHVRAIHPTGQPGRAGANGLDNRLVAHFIRALAIHRDNAHGNRVADFQALRAGHDKAESKLHRRFNLARISISARADIRLIRECGQIKTVLVHPPMGATMVNPAPARVGGAGVRLWDDAGQSAAVVHPRAVAARHRLHQLGQHGGRHAIDVGALRHGGHRVSQSRKRYRPFGARFGRSGVRRPIHRQRHVGANGDLPRRVQRHRGHIGHQRTDEKVDARHRCAVALDLRDLEQAAHMAPALPQPDAPRRRHSVRSHQADQRRHFCLQVCQRGIPLGARRA